MKKYFLHFVLSLLLLLGAALGIFYCWAQQPNWPWEEHLSLKVDPSTSYHMEEADGSFSLLTYNIGYLSGMTNNRAVKREPALFDENLHQAKHLLSQLQPDILCFQEIDYASRRSYGIDQEQALAVLGYSYSARAVNWDKKYVPFPYWPPSAHFGKLVSGQSTLSKFPISSHTADTLERVGTAPFYYKAFYLERLAQISKIAIGQHQLIVINVHLEAFDQATRRAHTEAVLQLYQRYSKDYPTILCGDFNSSPDEADAAIHSLFQDQTIGVSALGTSQNGSYENTFSSAEPTKRLDYIFYSKDWLELIDARVVKEAGLISDHLPVWARFSFKATS